MKLFEKIQFLRKQLGYSQEELSEYCSVSRQAVSKWESNQSVPELDKLILLSNLWNISLDTLLKDDMELDSTLINNTCHKNIIDEKNGYYEGLLIKESISNENILDILNINKIELWQTSDNPKYWTILHFTTSDLEFPQKISKVLKEDGNWFVDFKHENTKYIVFYDKILSYQIGNEKSKLLILKECQKRNLFDLSNIPE